MSHVRIKTLKTYPNARKVQKAREGVSDDESNEGNRDICQVAYTL